ncbi:TM1266 family iron-only hydrogenase system putative regulator [Pseudodesulfovibrio methanolicus]|uniref:TM1266 family iron-only hydrogenase system putative regulator n=1 Tax=Pseudodesulfovibrio methanolicus TaxID=3126690 RepID=A0ABZ2IW15_9BACT
MQKRLGIIGIIIKDRNRTAGAVNNILSDHGEMIVGRMGLPFRERGVSIIDLIIEASTDEVGALTGKLGMLDGVQVKSLLV